MEVAYPFLKMMNHHSWDIEDDEAMQELLDRSYSRIGNSSPSLHRHLLLLQNELDLLASRVSVWHDNEAGFMPS